MARYIAFYKPYGVTSHFGEHEKHKTLSSFGLPGGVYAAGRLDKDSEGLLLLTDDGPFKNELLHPENAHHRIYWAQVEGIPDKVAMRMLRQGPVIGGRKSKPCEARLMDPEPAIPDRNPPIRYRENVPETWVEIELTEGKNRQVRRMTAAVGHPTLRLIRVQIGKLNLWNLGIQEGEWTEVDRAAIL